LIASDRSVDPASLKGGTRSTEKHNGQPRIKPAVDTYLNFNTVQKTQDKPHQDTVDTHSLGGRGICSEEAFLLPCHGTCPCPTPLLSSTVGNSTQIPYPRGNSRRGGGPPSYSIPYPGPNLHTLTSNGTIFLSSQRRMKSPKVWEMLTLYAVLECDGNVIEYVRLTNIYMLYKCIFYCYLVH